MPRILLRSLAFFGLAFPSHRLDYHEQSPIGIQLHGGRNMGIDYRNMKVAELP